MNIELDVNVRSKHLFCLIKFIQITLYKIYLKLYSLCHYSLNITH
jgi:hypothetical protein